MPTRLLRTCLLLMVCWLATLAPAAASHLLGGEMNYKYLDANGPTNAPFRYQVTVNVYLNKESGSVAPDGRPSVDITFYSKSQNGARIFTTTVPRTSFSEITPPFAGGCTLPNSQPPRVTLAKYITIVNLPLSFDGYYAVYSDVARNTDVTNLLNPGGTNMTLYTEMAPPLLPNSSPIFSDTAVAVICQGDTSILLNNAYDADGDRLIYSFGTPYQGQAPFGNFTPPPPSVNYVQGYSATRPFGSGVGNYAALNASNGLSYYAAFQQGKYAVAVDVKEYRTINGREILVGTTRRDIQLVARPCQPNLAPVFTPSSLAIRELTVEEGRALNFAVTSTDPEGKPLTMKISSSLLDGSGPFDFSVNGSQGTVPSGSPIGSTSVTATATVTGSFVFNTRCGNARTTPYDVVVSVNDNTCGSKTISEIYRITVTRAAGPNRILGDTVVCDRTQPLTYVAAGPTASTYRWTVRGGTIQGASTNSSVQVLWAAPGTGTLTLRGVSNVGCPTDSVQRSITIRPTVPLTVSADVRICPGASATLTASGGQLYSWTSSSGQTFTGSTITVTPAQTTTYTVLTSDGVCTNSKQVTVTVSPAAQANAGAAQTTCSGVPATLGSAPVAGYTYQWSPASNLSSPTVAQPVFTAPNLTTTAQTYTYTLTATTAQGCTASSTVTITVNPAAIANAGPDATLCDKKQVTIGTAALAGYTYQWSPAANLNSATTARPVFTARNTTQSPLVLTYVVTATSSLGCSARDTVLVTVNPRPLPDSIQGSVSVCPTVQGVRYSIHNPRNTAYQWQVVGGTIASGQGSPAITVNWGAATTAAAVSVSQLNSFGCSSDTLTLPVRVNQVLATARPTGPLQVCLADGPFTYQTQYTNGSSYGWQIVGGTQVSTSQATVQVRFTRVGLAKLVVTESSNPAGGICRGQSDTLYVNVLPSPAANLAISGPNRVCAGAGNVVFSLPGAAGSTYVFTLNGVPIPGTGNSVTVASPGASTTPYTVTIQETNANGCVGPLYTKTFQVIAPLAITGPASYCPESRTGLTYSATTLSGGQYQWTITGGTITGGQGTGTVTVDVPAGSANATLSVTETTSQSCAATFIIRPDNATVQLNTASVDAAAQDRSITLALQIPNNGGNANRVQILRRDAGSTGAYTPVGTVANTAVSFTDTGVDADSRAYQYQLNLTNACGTVLSSQTHTTMLTKATATQSAGGRDVGKVQVTWTAYQGFTVKEYRISRVADNGATELVATVPGTQLVLDLPSSTAGFNQCFRVQALSTDATARTSASNDACVGFENKLGFYNIITPNGDGKNDVFWIDNVQLYPRNTLTIFNRWGKQVYETRNYTNTYDGREQTQGMYYYQFRLEDGTSYKGWFELVR